MFPLSFYIALQPVKRNIFEGILNTNINIFTPFYRASLKVSICWYSLLIFYTKNVKKKNYSFLNKSVQCGV